MPGITNESENQKSLTNESLATGQRLKDMPVPLKDVKRPIRAPGSPIINESKNEKSLINEAENT